MALKLPLTGERFMPEYEGEIAVEHLHRYYFAREFVYNKIVLDIASGEGYGAALLADLADRVIGVDISRDAVLFAQTQYAASNLEFMVGTCSDIPLPTNSVDVIVSFETIEHHDQHDRMMLEFARVMKPSGLLIISSPDRYRYSVLTGYTNPFHVKELYQHEFEELLQRYFSNVLVGGQRSLFGSAILFDKSTIDAVSYELVDGRFLRSTGLLRPIYNIAVASNSPLPSLSQGVLIEAVTKSDAFRSVATQRAELDSALARADERSADLEQELKLAGERATEIARSFEHRIDALTEMYQRAAADLGRADLERSNLGEERQALQAELRTLREARDFLLRKLQKERRRRQRMRRSFSWRLTRPLRLLGSVAAWLQGTKRRASGSIRQPVNGAGHEAVSPSVPPRIRDTVAKHFDVDHYLSQKPGPPVNANNALDHYLEHGWRLGLNPVVGFNNDYYLERYPDVRVAGINPFWHYLTNGQCEGRRTVPFFFRKQQQLHRPLVSVIVPNYNHAKFLQTRLDSVINQTYANLEIIILDDSSTDNSLEIIARFEAEHPGAVRVVRNEKNSGNVFKQWRRGIELARGDLLWICESDDFAELSFLAQTVTAFTDESVMIAFGRIQFSDSEGRVLEGLDAYREEAEAGAWNAINVRPAREWFHRGFGVANLIANVGGCLIRKQPLDSAIWDEACSYQILGDWYLYAVLARGGRIAYLPNAVTYFRQHSQNTSVASFRQPEYYREHQRIAEFLRRRWAVPQETVTRLITNVVRQYQRCIADGTPGQLEKLFDVQRVLTTPRKSTHVLIVSLGFEVGGGELFPIHLANELVGRGLVVSFATVRSLPREESVRGQLDRRIAVYESELIREIGVRQFIEQAGIDLIHSHSVGAEQLFLLDDPDAVKIPYIVTLHGSYECSIHSAEFLSLVERRVSHWVYLTERNLSHLWRDLATGALAASVSRIPNAMPVDARHFPFSRTDLGIGPEDVVFAIASRAIPEKGWAEAIAALRVAQVRTTRRLFLVFCGSGPEADRLQARDSHDEALRFMGFQEAIHGLYRLADCALLASNFAGESYPLTIIQALQVGTPVIATDVGEIPHMLRADDRMAGIIVKIHEDGADFIDRLAAAMLRMADEEFRHSCAADAARLGQRFDMRTVGDSYLTCYGQFVEVGVSDRRVESSAGLTNDPLSKRNTS